MSNGMVESMRERSPTVPTPQIVVCDDLAVDHIVPSALDPRVGPAVAAAVAAASKL